MDPNAQTGEAWTKNSAQPNAAENALDIFYQRVFGESLEDANVKPSSNSSGSKYRHIANEDSGDVLADSGLTVGDYPEDAAADP